VFGQCVAAARGDHERWIGDHQVELFTGQRLQQRAAAQLHHTGTGGRTWIGGASWAGGAGWAGGVGWAGASGGVGSTGGAGGGGVPTPTGTGLPGRTLLSRGTCAVVPGLRVVPLRPPQ